MAGIKALCAYQKKGGSLCIAYLFLASLPCALEGIFPQK